MSRWSHRRELHIVVSPEHVALLQMRRSMTWRGLRRVVSDAYGVSCDSTGGAQPWRAALLELEAALPGYADGKTAATVILSNHFLRYALVPCHAELVDAEEELSFARHCFTRIYGESARQWELCLSQQTLQAPRLASAVDAELLEMLRAMFDGAGVALQSIQPHLMTVFNRCRGYLGKRSAWFALLEPGNLCLALVSRGTWQRVRGLRVGPTWHLELPLILEREAYLAGLQEVPHEVYLWNAGAGAMLPPESDTWQFHTLNPALEGGASPDPGKRIAWAMAG